MAPIEQAAHPVHVDGQLFRRVVGNLTSGVSVVTTTVGTTRSGMTASSVTSLSLDPPMMLVCINKAVPMSQAVSQAGRFAVNVLAEDGAHLAARFAAPHPDKFDGVAVEAGTHGLPLLSEALAHLECEVVEAVEGGTHLVFFGRVLSASFAEDREPLAYFRGKFGRFEFAANDEVYRRVRSILLERTEYGADAVVEPSLARALDVEEAAVFYALTRLSNDGLVRRDPQRGYVVVPIDVTFCDQVFEARAAIQIGVIERVLAHVDESKIAALGPRLDEMARCIRDDTFTDFDRYLEANFRFHVGIVEFAENATLESAFGSLSIKTVMARSFGSTTATSVDFVEVQRRIHEALIRRDQPGAIAAIHQYSDMARVRAREVLRWLGGEL
jgi:flavin reductase (DIM6/NTAB) family NADH-FMN oxidoreductase RutF/DNA-binding GntR family transcriptional regulator